MAYEGEVVVTLGPSYVEHELLVHGTANTYDGPATGPADVVTTDNAFVTRIVVRHPVDAARFSGRVVVEPFNTSAGTERDVVWHHVGDLLQEQGDAWVGVTTRAHFAAKLPPLDPLRYADIDLASNDLGWDVLVAVGRLIRTDPTVLPDLTVERCYLAGYSQSATDTATFAMAMHPQARQDDGSPLFDGYFPAGHSGSLTSLSTGRHWLPRLEASPMTAVDVPLIDVETQTDVEGFEVDLGRERPFRSTGGAYVRREDADPPHGHFRLYEVAGAPHAPRLPDCDGPGSSFPLSAFLRAGLSHLFAWAEQGTSPPVAERIVLAHVDVVTTCATDDVGNALGGVRSPFVDVPLARYEVHSGPGPMCALVGREVALEPAAMRARHGDLESYLEAFRVALDHTVAAGFLLLRDRDPLYAAHAAKAELAFAPAERP